MRSWLWGAGVEQWRGRWVKRKVLFSGGLQLLPLAAVASFMCSVSTTQRVNQGGVAVHSMSGNRTGYCLHGQGDGAYVIQAVS